MLTVTPWDICIAFDGQDIAVDGFSVSENGSILSKKSFGGKQTKFSELLMRFVRSDVRDHIASRKDDRGSWYRHY